MRRMFSASARFTAMGKPSGKTPEDNLRFVVFVVELYMIRSMEKSTIDLLSHFAST